jgi:hypothetical protein
LNNLSNNNIYPSSTLLIKQGVIVPVTAATESPQATDPANYPIWTASPHDGSTTPLPEESGRFATTDNAFIMNVMIGIIALALVGGWSFTWLGGFRKK